MIRYTDTTDGLTPDRMHGFFVGWPNPPSEETFLRLLNRSDEIVLAVDDETDRLIGFVTAITDGVLAAYIPLLEVLPEYQGRKIGTELMNRLLQKLERYYMVDLLCLDKLRPFYERFGLGSAHAMCFRRFEYQSGIEADSR